MNRYLVAVRVAPGAIQPYIVCASDQSEACERAEFIAAELESWRLAGRETTAPVVFCRRVYA